MKRQIPWDIRAMYIAPALFLLLSIGSGIFTALVCIKSRLWIEGLPIGIFIISIVFHLIILIRWKHYIDYAPLAYALIQPALHAFFLLISLALSLNNPCQPKRYLKENEPAILIPEERHTEYEDNIDEVLRKIEALPIE